MIKMENDNQAASMLLKEEVKALAYKIHDKTIDNRRHLHAHPELSFNEWMTSGFIKAYLEEMKIPWEPMADTGIVAIIRGSLPSERVIALRADMDALPILEMNETSYASRHKGVMHACGHDAHTASLLGTAFILQTLAPRFGGTVKLIFQPGEEKLPGGASLMIKEGVMDDPRPSAILGQHVMPSIPVGKIGIRKGKMWASMDELSVTIHGKGGHGAMPHHNIDPVLITAHILTALQQLVSRNADPMLPNVLSFGKLIADGTINIIPDKVTMEGTFRTMDESWRNEAHGRMKKMAIAIAESMGGRCEFTIVRGYPVLVNEAALTDRVGRYAMEYLGKDQVIEVEPAMVAEDFSYYSQVTDSCFYLLGVGNQDKGIVSYLHTPTFNIDEGALALSTGLMAWLAIKELGNE
jgi:amidohydrolase